MWLKPGENKTIVNIVAYVPLVGREESEKGILRK